LGWNGIGQLNLQSLQVAGIRVQDQKHAVVTLLALLNGQLMELGVPVAATGSGLVVSGEPAWLPAPPRTSPPPAPRGQITVTVIWQVPVTEQPGSTVGNLGMASKLKMTYGMSVVDLQSGKWYVNEFGASSEAVRAR